VAESNCSLFPTAKASFFFPPNFLTPDLVGHLPGVEPLQLLPLSVRALHTEADILEEDEEASDCEIERQVEHCLRERAELPGAEIEAEASAEDGEIERRVVVMYIAGERNQ